MILCVCECVSIKLHITVQFESCHPSHFVPLALIPPRGGSMILVTKSSDQTRQRGVCVYVYQIAHKNTIWPCHCRHSIQYALCVYIYQIAHNRAIRLCHPRHSMPLALTLKRGGSIILITQTSDQTRQRGHTLSTFTVLTYILGTLCPPPYFIAILSII